VKTNCLLRRAKQAAARVAAAGIALACLLR
jgi:hypothetical protein